MAVHQGIQKMLILYFKLYREKKAALFKLLKLFLIQFFIKKENNFILKVSNVLNYNVLNKCYFFFSFFCTYIIDKKSI